jgi:hypothetical protein
MIVRSRQAVLESTSLSVFGNNHTLVSVYATFPLTATDSKCSNPRQLSASVGGPVATALASHGHATALSMAVRQAAAATERDAIRASVIAPSQRDSPALLGGDFAERASSGPRVLFHTLSSTKES